MSNLIKPTAETIKSNHADFGHTKELLNTYLLQTVVNGGIIELARVKYYMSYRAQGRAPLYCSVQVRTDIDGYLYTCGNYSVSGCGYQKEVAALGHALTGMGFDTLDKTGPNSMSTMRQGGGADVRGILEMLGASLGFDSFLVTTISG